MKTRLSKAATQFFWLAILLIFAFCAEFARADDHGHSEHRHDEHADEGEHDEHAHEGEHAGEHGEHEEMTTISNAVAERSGIKTEKAAPRLIKTLLKARGKILPSEHKIAHIIPRFAGIVREGKKHIGDKVEKGEVLAIIESNESLQPFEVSSQIPGTIINGHLIVGEFVPENQWVYIVADLSEVWADFHIPLRERRAIKIGQIVEIRSIDETKSTTGKVSYLAPYADERSQSQLIRVVVPNEEQLFLPGMFVGAEILVDESEAKVAIKKQALQTFEDKQVVFVKNAETYQPRPIVLGKADSEYVEVLSGLSADEEYVTENPFLLKADILKSAAEHDH